MLAIFERPEKRRRFREIKGVPSLAWVSKHEIISEKIFFFQKKKSLLKPARIEYSRMKQEIHGERRSKRNFIRNRKDEANKSRLGGGGGEKVGSLTKIDERRKRQ